MTERNTWHPIADFDFNAPYATDLFLVWVLFPMHDGAPGLHFQECWLEGGKFMGTWRYVQHEDLTDWPDINNAEPVAFMLVEPPAFTDGPRASRLVPKAA